MRIVLTASPYAIPCGGTTSGTATAYRGTDVANDILVTVTAPGGNTSASQYGAATVSYTATEADCGKTIYFSGSASGVTQTPTFGIDVVKLQFDHDLWYFYGVDAKNYYEVVKLNAPLLVGRTGSFEWSITKGEDKAEFDVGSGVYGKDYTTTTPEIKVHSKGGSNAKGDITIELTWGGSVFTLDCTAYKPTAKVVSGPVDQASGNGYKSYWTFEIDDQFGTKIKYPLEVNEKFSDHQIDYQGSNWPLGTETVFTTGGGAPSTYYDEQQVGDGSLTPKPLAPGTSGQDTPVDNYLLIWRAGSEGTGQGIEILRKRIQRNRGNARHQN